MTIFYCNFSMYSTSAATYFQSLSTHCRNASLNSVMSICERHWKMADTRDDFEWNLHLARHLWNKSKSQGVRLRRREVSQNFDVLVHKILLHELALVSSCTCQSSVGISCKNGWPRQTQALVVFPSNPLLLFTWFLYHHYSLSWRILWTVPSETDFFLQFEMGFLLGHQCSVFFSQVHRIAPMFHHQ